MIGPVLERSLQMVARRLQKLRVLRRQSLCWLLLMIPAVIICLWMPTAGFLRNELVVVLAATVVGVLLSRMLVRRPSDVETARLIEQRYPELNDAVLTAVRVHENSGANASILTQMVIQDADQLARQADWTRVVPGRQMLIWSAISLLTFVMMVSGVMAASRWGRSLQFSRMSAPPEQSAEFMQQIADQLVVEPGDVELEQGTALTAVARFPTVIPLRVLLEFTTTDGQIRQLPMSPTVDDGVFAARMEQIISDGTYVVRFGDRNPDDARAEIDLAGTSPQFKVSTYIRPGLEQIDVQVTPPEYTGRDAQLIEDTLRVVAVEGSALKLRLKLNKPVELVELRAKDGGAMVLPTSTDDPLTAEISLLATQNQSWSVYLQDSAGRTAADEPVFSVRITQNGRPQLKVTFPGRDTNVSALQEFAVEAEAADDFGIVNYGIQYAITGNEEQLVSLAPGQGSGTESTSESASTERALPLKVNIPYVIDLEAMQAKPDDLVTYYFFADDYGPDGSVRRTYGDMMVAEVRRFEEIFREAQQSGEQQQQQQQGQQQSPVDGVLQLQKEIISATWNTLRSESERRQAGTLQQDVTVITESQTAAIEQLAELQERVGGEEKLVALGQAAVAEMNKALELLGQYRDQQAGASLSSVLLPEQAAYQTLMKMRAAEFQVRQQQQQQGQQGQGQGQNSASQQQLQQLELDNSRNRYESERQAEQQQQMTEQQRNQLQVLNRLKELARRQQMLNERMKQLESELRTATSDSQREEIEQQLKRLRDEQREMLRDVDELRDRVDQAGRQQPQDAPIREQIEQARSNVQQAARAMDEGRLSEAIAEGTRAERQFEQLKNDFRDQTSSRFTDAMRDLKDQARELSEQQQQLSRRLTGESPGETQGNDTNDAQRPSLRSSRNREELEKQAADQRDRLERVMDEANRIVEQSEQSEPLLSSRLYDALREARESKVKEAVEATEMLAGRGLWAQSRQAEEIARQGIEQLRKSVDQAADAVLGSEADAMRRAQSELKDLSQQLAEEVRNATGESESSQSTQNGEPSSRNAAYGQQQDGQQQDGQQQDGQQQGGQQQGGQQQGGQQQGGQQQGGQQQGGQQQGGQQQDGQQQDGQQQDGQQQDGQQQDGQQQGGQQQDGQQQGDSQRPGGQRRGTQSQSAQSQSLLRGGGRQDGGGGGGSEAAAQPLTGEDFTRWSDRLRDVEEMLEDPELRNRVAQARDRARAIRADFKRHGQEPQWDLVKSGVLSELQSLQSRIAEELLRLESNRSMVPIDREPVPEEFDSLVQRYYELLGQQRQKEPLK